MRFLSILVGVFAGASAVLSLTISEINGHKYLSPYNGQAVTNVKGLVTAKGVGKIFSVSITKLLTVFTAKWFLSPLNNSGLRLSVLQLNLRLRQTSLSQRHCRRYHYFECQCLRISVFSCLHLSDRAHFCQRHQSSLQRQQSHPRSHWRDIFEISTNPAVFVSR